jgi:YfiR/HmsC-like
MDALTRLIQWIRRTLVAVLAAALLLLPALPARAQGVVATEYAVKAAFLYHFAKFIEWPASVGGPSPKAVTLCVVGNDPFGDALDELASRGVEGLAEGIRVRVLHVAGPTLEAGCHIAFISNSERPRLAAHLADAAQAHAVTVSDLDGFAEAGGAIQFVIEDGKVRFWINRSAAEQAGVRLSSRLLALARIVKGAAER